MENKKKYILVLIYFDYYYYFTKAFFNRPIQFLSFDITVNLDAVCAWYLVVEKHIIGRSQAQAQAHSSACLKVL